MYTRLPLHKYQDTSNRIDIVLYIYVMSTTFWYQQLYRKTQPTKHFVEDLLQSPLDLATVFQEREVHKPNSRTEYGWIGL